MSRVTWTYENPGSVLWTLLILCVIAISLASCNKSETTATASQRTFDSPASAGTAMYEAAKSGDQSALLAIFGSQGKDLLSSGDATKDKDTLQDFVAAYDQMNRWVKIRAGGQILQIGADNYPFPIPLDQNKSGQWYFDTAAGRDEILARRIGADELSAIAVCGFLTDAQQQYFSQTHDGDTVRQYAQKLISDAGKQNGLYWPASQGQSESPLGPLEDFAKALGYVSAGDKPQPFNGYYFKLLSSQGGKAQGGAGSYLLNGKMIRGFAFLAYPAEYRNSGIMTFVVSKDGIVYQRDLGEETSELASAMTEYNPDEGWNPAIEKQSDQTAQLLTSR